MSQYRDRQMQRQEAEEALSGYYGRFCARARQEAAASTAPEPDEPMEVDPKTEAAEREWWRRHNQPITREWMAKVYGRHPLPSRREQS